MLTNVNKYKMHLKMRFCYSILRKHLINFYGLDFYVHEVQQYRVFLYSFVYNFVLKI